MVAVSGDRVIGTGMLGVRGSRGWIGMVGVIPAYRSQGIARRIMEHLIEQAGQRDLQSLQLEVITQNQHAHGLYESLGFTTRRRLLVLFRPVDDAPEKRDAMEHLTLRAIPPERALRELEILSTASHPWQREISSLQAIAGKLEGLTLMNDIDDHLLGCIIYHAEVAHGAFLAAAANSREVGEYLITSVLRMYPDAEFSYVNIPDNDPLLSSFFELGFEESLAQFEMFLTLDARLAG